VYKDEAYIHSSHTAPKNCRDDCLLGLPAPILEGKLLVLHAGGNGASITNIPVIFRCNQTIRDYHNGMKNENYFCWLKEKLISNLEQNSVLFINNASYHNIQRDNAPKLNSNEETTTGYM
jgi:hypothetical protein